MSTRDQGLRAEDRAAELLAAQGYRIVERNVRTKTGELDVIAWEGETLCFVEVRSTADADHGGPLATVNESKQRRVIRAAREYLLTLGREVAVRFEVVGLWNEGGVEKHLVVRGAFVANR